MIRVAREVYPTHQTAEMREWNAQVEQRKRDKLQRKITKHTTSTGRDPVHLHAGKWWFWDETWANAIGPYDHEFQAKQAMESYCKMLDGPNASAPI